MQRNLPLLFHYNFFSFKSAKDSVVVLENTGLPDSNQVFWGYGPGPWDWSKIKV